MASTADQQHEGGDGVRAGAPGPGARAQNAGGLVELPDAQAAILAAVRRLAGERVALEQALGRVLAEDLRAEEPVPSFDSSAMDGFAVRAEDLAGASHDTPVQLAVVGESRAGSPAPVALDRGQAIAISTGAMLPEGADAVVQVENTRRKEGDGDARDSHAARERAATAATAGVVEMWAPVDPGLEIRRAGEDMRAGEAALARGTVLGPAAIGVLASLGRAEALCTRRPRVSLLLTGDELIAPAEQSRPGTVRDSNSHALAALARCCGAEVARIGRVPDEAGATRAMLAAALQDVDALVICGGMSVGVHDHVRPSLDALGAVRSFWGLALKPGKPTWFGTLSGTPVFGLPGNPVSAMVTFTLLVAPALRAMQGAGGAPGGATATLDVDYRKPAGRAHAVRCRLRAERDGWHAEPTGPQGSHILTSLLLADALAVVPSQATFVPAGSRLEIVRLPAPAEAFA